MIVDWDFGRKNETDNFGFKEKLINWHLADMLEQIRMLVFERSIFDENFEKWMLLKWDFRNKELLI